MRFGFLAWLLASIGLACPAAADEPFELRDGDRVVFIGSTLVERDQAHGYVEAMLTARWPDRSVLFRNLAWSGDTVWGDARAGFDTAAEGFKRLVEQVAAVRPTVIFLQYGTNESFDGEPGLPRFRQGLARLLDELQAHAPRIVLLSPLAQESIAPRRVDDRAHRGPSPDAQKRNQQIAPYVAEIRQASVDRGHRFVDLFTPGNIAVQNGEPLYRTENGMHAGAFGHWRLARAIADALELRPADEIQRIGESESVVLQSSAAAKLRDFEKTESGFRFHARFETLPVLPTPSDAAELDVPVARRFKFSGLPAGAYQMRVDGKAVDGLAFEAAAGADVWVAVPESPELAQWDQLRQATIEKNRHYFHRWRPQNETYLFGFRKHEQGQNAVEVPEFERLVAELESRITELRTPVEHKYELIRVTRKSAGQIPAMIPDPDPEIERQTFQVPDGFEVNLFAADPMLAKPIQMNWDAAGRLWIASSEVYPQIEPGQTANDKILVLDDSDGDGRADRTTVFADDGLLIPTGVEPGDGGAYVANSTELLHLRDTNGDGRADSRRVMLSGFGTEDTHHIIHTFRWGHDGCLYFNQSIYIHSHVETPWGIRRLGGGGIWQFRPETWRLDVFARGFVNTWGHHFDDWGQSFATDGAYGEGINYVFPGATFFSAPGATRIMKGLNPGSPKHCGLEIVSGRHLPDDWQGNMVTNDFRGHRVCRFVISEDGSGYASREQPELIRSDHVAFRPIDVKMGPDGAIYVADWYNPIIQHGEVDFRDPRRDHTRGRIWRVSAKGRPLVPRPRLTGATIEQLLDALESPEQWTRHFARRVLKERGAADVLPELQRRTAQAVRDPEPPRDALEWLWTYQSLDVAEPVLLQKLLRADDHRVRAAATRVLAQWIDRVPDPLDSLAVQVADVHPRVRLEAVRALARVESAPAADLAMRALDQPVDSSLDYALWATARDLAPHWLPRAQRGSRSSERGFGGNPRHQTFALLAVAGEAAVSPLLGLMRERKIPGESEANVLALVARHGSPDELGLVLDLVISDSAYSPDRRYDILAALDSSSRQRHVQPAGDLGRLATLFESAPADHRIRELILRLGGRWRVQAMRGLFTRIAGEAVCPDPLRHAAMDALALLRDSESREALEAFCSSDHAMPVRRGAVAALTTVDVAAAARHAATLLAETRSDADASAVFASFLERKDGPNALAAALADSHLSSDVAKIGVRLAQAAGRSEPDLIAALTRSGELGEPPAPLSPESLQAMVHEVIDRGDPARGEAVFRRPELQCLKCHALAGTGGQAGPDLLSVGASAPIDYLIESLIDPNKKVKEGFHSVVLATNDGRVVTGLKVRQTDSELVLRDAEDREVPIPLGSIEEQKTGGSIMPSGLTDSITRSELLDLVRFLSELGKVGPYSAQGRVARRWRTLAVTPELAREISHAGLKSVLATPSRLSWATQYATMSGSVPLGELKPIQINYQSRLIGVLRCELLCTTPGRVQLLLNSAEGLEAWLDDSAVELGATTEIELSAGRHTLTIAVDLRRRTESLRCALGDVPGSAAQVQFVAGK